MQAGFAREFLPQYALLFGFGQFLRGVPSGFEVILGTIASYAEMVGGILIIIGLFTRIGSLLIIGTLTVATILNLNGNFFSWDYPSQMGFGAIMLFFAGAGRYSLDKALFK